MAPFRINIFYLPALLFIAASCASTSYYAPNPANVPLHTESGSVKLQGGLAAAIPSSELLQVQASAAFTSHWAAIGNYAEIETSMEDVADNASLWDAGLGYYTTLADWNKDPVVFEVYSGYGRYRGTVETLYGNSQFGAHRYFLQPNIGIVGKYMEAGFALRAMGIDYYEEDPYQADLLGTEHPDMFRLNNVPLQFVIEPSVTYRFRYKFLYLQTQWLYSFNLTDENFPQDFSTISLTFGVHLTPALTGGR